MYARAVRVAIVLSLAGCGGTAHHADHDHDKPKLAPYMALFERGKTWRLPIETTAGHRDQPSGAWIADPSQKSTLVCRVADVRALGDGKLARVACDRPHDGLLAAGTWVVTRAGLFHPPGEPSADDAARYETGEPLIAKPSDDASATSTAFVFEGSWCVRETAADAVDRRDYTLCFDPKGVSGGGEIVIAGPDQTWQRATFGKAPPDPDDPTEKR